MLKNLFAATAMLVIANCANAFAQIADDEPSAQSKWSHHLSDDDMKAFTDARIAALKAGLQLTPDQEKNWPPLEQAIRDLAKLRIERMHAREGGTERPRDPFDGLQRRAEAMSQLSSALKRLADAGTPLYQSLSDAQKHRFVLLARILRPHQMRWTGFWHPHEDTGHDRERGFGGMKEPSAPRRDMGLDTGDEDL